MNSQRTDGQDKRTYRRGRKSRDIPEGQLPNQVRRLRLERGMTLQHVANYVGVHYTAIHQVETKGTGISRRKWYRLADLFDRDPRDLENARSICFRDQTSS
jgi:transcriptional regulator with XRE-family HTH domain